MGTPPHRKRLLTRRRFLAVAGGGVLALAILRLGIPWWLRPGPIRPISDPAQQLVKERLAGLDMSRVWDGHVHLIGMDEGGNGCRVNPDLRSHFHPWLRFQFDAFRAAGGIRNNNTADSDYLQRLLALHRNANPSGRMVLLAFDQVVNEAGTSIPGKTAFYVPNEYVLTLGERFPEIAPCVSIHPYRQDAVDRLDQAVEQGAVAVKWLPNAQGIDPASPLCDRFYRRLQERNIPLLTHAGHEMSVDSSFQKFGNPLRLRRGLDLGATIVVAHCASYGRNLDLDQLATMPPSVDSFDLFMRMFRDDRYRENLYGDISSATLVNRAGRPLRELLAATELHPRLINGTDYPLPVFGALVWPRILERDGLITKRERKLYQEIQRSNPLLADLILKRCLKLEREGVTCRFSPDVFHGAAGLYGGLSR
jgi:predicted TIM-barrel fold metal-dependent hydrolase